MTDPTPTRDEAVARIMDDLRPYARKTLGSIRIDVVEVCKIVEWYDSLASAPAPASGRVDAVAVLSDPVAVHMNMLRGSIAKPSLNNIAHLYPEVQRMKQALLATLKHFRWPTSAEHQTRDQVTAALAAFDDPPMTPAASLSPDATPVSEAGGGAFQSECGFPFCSCAKRGVCAHAKEDQTNG